METARILNIQHLCTHDGPGIRTTVFIKGCPLRCAWCHNPESVSPDPELLFHRRLCALCGQCAKICPYQVHGISAAEHRLDRAKCRQCFACIEGCHSGALEKAGREMSADEVLAEVAKDRVFYETSGGGVTLSGGEPLASFEFSLALLGKLRDAGLDTCVETCGFAPQDRVLEMSRSTCLLLWDIKHTDATLHARYTGVPLQPILDNLRAVDAAGGRTILRCTLVADVNMTREHFDRIADLAASLRNCRGVELLPYHPLGLAKAESMGCAASQFQPPAPAALRQAQAYIAARTNATPKGIQRSTQD